MITIQEKAKLLADQMCSPIDVAPTTITFREINEYIENAFIAGAKFAETFISVDDELPPEEKKFPRASIDCFVLDSSGRVFVAIYAFFLKEWWSNETQEKLLNIVKWRPITRQ